VARHAIESDEHSGDYWAPYPSLNQASFANSAALLQPVMASLCDLAIIATATQEVMLNTATETETGEPGREVVRMLAQLHSWHDGLPDMLSVQGHPVPQVLLVQ
jgi:hypothetical protein